MRFPSRWPTTRRVLVQTKTDRTFRGVLWAKRGPILIIRSAELLERDKATPVDGELLLERTNLDWIQVL